MVDYCLKFEQLRMNDVDRVGGKNASLGEMISGLTDLGVSVPTGYATTADAFRAFLSQSGLDNKIHDLLDNLDIDDVDALVTAGARIRRWVVATPFIPELEESIRQGYRELCDGQDAPVAVRSSATAEDLPDASFAGQQETFLNIKGEDNVLHAVKEVFASLFNDRAISYRVHQRFDHREVALSAGVQRMVRSETGASGVMFTLDTESGNNNVFFITASWGLGEMVVQGAVNPDEFYVHKQTLAQGFSSVVRRNLGSKAEKMVYDTDGSAGKSVKVVQVSETDRKRFCLSDEDVVNLAKQAAIIEQHYGRPMDIEWGKDGDDGKLYILQARPETVASSGNNQSTMERYILNEKGNVLVEGRAIGGKIGSGTVRVVSGLGEMNQVQNGEILVTDMTDPDWEPVMKRCAAIVTNRGGRTCHAAIIARELGIAAVVGCENATEILKSGQSATVSCAEGDTGFVYDRLLDYERITNDITSMGELPIDIMMNVANPDRALSFAMLPHKGVGLARLEFIINRQIGIHPKALLQYDSQSDELKATIDEKITGYASPVDFYVEKIVEGVATIAGAFYPEKVIVRLSDFKSNEYANLIGGEQFEPHEENPMIGFRGASRYISEDFRDCFELECRAMKKVREQLGLTNVWLMIPFVRTVSEAQQVSEIMADFGLRRGENGLKLVMMCELPSNAILADQFLEYFDGFSIGSNDMTQLTLGLDRDSGLIAHLFDERNEAVLKLLEMAIEACRKQNKYVGICGQGPSDHPDLALWLMERGISSVSLTPDSVLETWTFLAKKYAN